MYFYIIAIQNLLNIVFKSFMHIFSNCNYFFLSMRTVTCYVCKNKNYCIIDVLAVTKENINFLRMSAAGPDCVFIFNINELIY